jgi:cold shock CspA family protein
MKWYNGKKGYGFLMRGGSDELFFHKSNVLGNLYDFVNGEWVLYDVEETHKGMEAIEIEQYDKS